MESSNSTAASEPVVRRMVEIAGQVYNPDHIVKVDLRKAPEFATVHHTTGVDEYSGQDAIDLARFFGATPAQPAPPAAAPTPAKTRRQKA